LFLSFLLKSDKFSDFFFTLQDKHNIRTLSLNIKFICTRCETGCQGCLLRGPRHISTSFILVCALRCTNLQGTRKVYSQAEQFIRLVRIKQKCIRIAYLYSKCTDCRIKINIMFKEIMKKKYTLLVKTNYTER
jgi:hypothetical protein